MPLFEHSSLQCLQLVSSVSSENIESSENGVSIVSNIVSANSLCGGATSISDTEYFFSFSFMIVPICRRSSLTPGVHYLRSSCFPSEEEQSGLMNAPQEVESWGYFNTSASFTIAVYGQLEKYPYWPKKVLVIQYLAIVVFCVPLAVLPRTWCSDGPSRALGGQTAV